ncbi:hypothetical protein PGO_114550 [Plasmodium gonderi]|uniref:Uncharacterized protein n=1 Tax=Plasmodium gonderi TaxID=77519 RepID=A0A1Y1JHK2_PLAGO|nr:hypothetical protein PGO_114550 [Plasmodium gonderi]GAW82001.1 hypothetical protein PGO_114550 [Plasmodium gonderi]
MPTFLICLYYLNFLIEVLLGIHIFGIDSQFLLKCRESISARGNTRWIRNLTERDTGNDGTIVNDKGLTINELEELCKNRDPCFANKIYGISLYDTKELFVEITNFVLYQDYEEHVKTEKKIFTFTYRTLTFMEEKIKDKIEELVSTAKRDIDELFGNYDFLDKKELESISNLNLFLDINGNQDVLLVNGIDVYFYIMEVKFSKKIPINTQNALENFTELLNHNESIFSEYIKKVYKIEKDIKAYLVTGGNRFPLDYTHWNNSYIKITQNVAVRAFLDDFFNYFYDLEKKIKGNSSKVTRIDMHFLNGTLQAINDIIKSTIEQKTYKLFEMLNKLFYGDLKSILGFFTYIFDKERKKNEVILNAIASEKTGDVYDNNFLFDIESLYTEEKKDIETSVSRFSDFMKTNFGFNIHGKNVQMLKSNISNSDKKKEIMKLFKIIVHELLCRKQVVEFFNLLNLMKRNSKTVISYFRRMSGYLTKKNDSSIFVETKKLIPLMSKFFEIKERNCCDLKEKDSDTNIFELMKQIKNTLYRYRVSIKILHLLIEELKLAKELNAEYDAIVTEKKKKQKESYGNMEIDKEKRDEAYEKALKEWTKKLESKKLAIDSNKNAILFYLCLIKEFKLN